MIINEKILKWSYYFKKLPIYLQNSYGYPEHFKILYQIMLDTNSTANDLLRAMNLTNPNYFHDLDISQNEDSSDLISPTGYEFDLLDKMASLYGVTRYFDVDYTNEKGDNIHKSLKLTNIELLKLILVKIVQNSFLGTYEDIRKLYTLIELPIYLYSLPLESGTVYLILDENSSTNVITDNIKDMFFANLLTIKSMGIQYKVYETEEKNIAIWDSNDANKLWDAGEWL